MATESKPIELGVECPKFQGLIGVDSKKHSLEDYQWAKLLVVGFTCNHCPYVQAYEDRLNDLASEYQSKGVAFVCINSNDSKKYPDDAFEKMQERAQAKNFSFDYLQDTTQSVARAFNAACTPEFYVYDQDRILRYHGRLDDNQEIKNVQRQYLRDALSSLLNDQKPAIEQTAAIGCSIKWS